MKILIVLTSHDQLGDTGKKTGFWLEEFAAPYYVLKDAGAAIAVASPKGGLPPLDPKSEMPEFQTVYGEVKDDNVQFLGVDVKDQRQLAQAFVDSIGVEYPSMFDPRGEVALSFRGFPANVVPTTILIDRSNRVAAVYIATVSEENLRTALDHLLAEADPE